MRLAFAKIFPYNIYREYCKMGTGECMMNLKAGLWQQQTMKLTMTQELTQAIALLQYSTQELSAFLESKALDNPLLK